MQNIYSTQPPRCKAQPRLADPISWSGNNEYLTRAAVRLIQQRVNCSPSVALALAEHAGLIREARHG